MEILSNKKQLQIVELYNFFQNCETDEELIQKMNEYKYDSPEPEQYVLEFGYLAYWYLFDLVRTRKTRCSRATVFIMYLKYLIDGEPMEANGCFRDLLHDTKCAFNIRYNDEHVEYDSSKNQYFQIECDDAIYKYARETPKRFCLQKLRRYDSRIFHLDHLDDKIVTVSKNNVRIYNIPDCRKLLLN